MNFEESVKYLYGLGNEVLAMKLGLENIRTILHALGNPQEKYLKVQIAGTNGKGSTCAFLEAICLKAGIRTGLTTSPHLVSVTERVRLHGVEISPEEFARYATRIREISESLVGKKQDSGTDSRFVLESIPTFFEQVTAIALLAFAEHEVELAILETGLGGRFDATTAAAAKIVAITPIDFDHQRILGETLTEIAGEKAAIIREDTKVIVSEQKNEAIKVIFDRCAEFGILPNLAENVRADRVSGRSESLALVNFRSNTSAYKNVCPGLLGQHQIDNAKTAILLAEALREKFKISKAAIISGLETARHRGRLEFAGRFLFDGAHNTSGANALRKFLDESVTARIIMIFGAMREKNLSEIARNLFPKAEKIILTKPDNPRSMETAEIIQFLPVNYATENVYRTETVAQAISTAQKIAAPEDLILITGSLYLIGEAQNILLLSSGA